MRKQTILKYIKNDTQHLRHTIFKKIYKNNDLSYDYCVEGKAGTLLLFDTTDIHGGVELKKGKRFISRIHFVEKQFNKFINPNLLDRIVLKFNQIIKNNKSYFITNSIF